jgi:hypothetical protein
MLHPSGCLQLLLCYPPHLEAVSSILKLTTRLAMLRKDKLLMAHLQILVT